MCIYFIFSDICVSMFISSLVAIVKTQPNFGSNALAKLINVCLENQIHDKQLAILLLNAILI